MTYDLEDANKLYEDSVEALKQVEESQEKREELIKQQREALQKALDNYAKEYYPH